MDIFSLSKKIISQETPLLESRTYLSYHKGTTLRKAEGLINVCVVYPNSYSVGMSNLGYMIVCDIFDSQHGVMVDRAFMPERGQKEARGLITGRLLRDFDLVVFSVSFELDFLNIKKILCAGDIEPDRTKRTNPMVICGGVAATINPYAIEDIVDLVLIGDAELLIPEFIEDYKDDKLEDFYNEVGCYNPVTRKNTGLKKLKDLEQCRYSSVITSNTVFANTVLLDGGRGCPYFCRFCVTGNYLNPFLAQDADRFIEIASRLKKFECKKFGIVSSSIGKIKNFNKFLEYSIENKLSISVSSLRFEDINEETVSLLSKVGQKQYTLAPESGSYDLRCSVSKPITDEEIISKVELIHSKGGSVKLYFMFGLPDETDTDLINIMKLISILNKTGEIRAGIQAFVPKPHTPFAQSTFVGEKIFKIKKQVIVDAANSIGVSRNFYNISDVKEAALEWSLSWKGRNNI